MVPAIRWDKPRDPSHTKHEYRYPDLYQPHMRLAAKPQHKVVLLDDVLTSGSQMIAATRFLISKGIQVVRGVSIARASPIQHDDTFGWKELELQIALEAFDADDI